LQNTHRTFIDLLFTAQRCFAPIFRLSFQENPFWWIRWSLDSPSRFLVDLLVTSLSFAVVVVVVVVVVVFVVVRRRKVLLCSSSPGNMKARSTLDE
jgi:hypothetical protein